MRKKINQYGSDRCCPNCAYKLRYSWLSGMSVPQIFLYSAESDEIIVSQKLFKMFSESGFDDVRFLSNLKKYLGDRGLDSKGFSMSNSLKCPNCKFDLNKRSDGSVSDKLRDKAFYLSGMVYRNDTDAFIIEMI